MKFGIKVRSYIKDRLGIAVFTHSTGAGRSPDWYHHLPPAQVIQDKRTVQSEPERCEPGRKKKTVSLPIHSCEDRILKDLRLTLGQPGGLQQR